MPEFNGADNLTAKTGRGDYGIWVFAIRYTG
jgi:hypothetical protein